MKKLLALVLSLTLCLTLAACASASPSGGSGGDSYELALITDIGTIDDKSFNQGSWEGLLQYATEKGISHQYYQPSEQSDDEYLSTIALAITGGAKVIVTPGFLFEVPIYEAQTRYPDVTFILVDGNPHTADYATYDTKSNTVGITYAEEQAGFLAGYAAVKEGYRGLGFMGGMAVPAVQSFGFGFVQGAEYAAQELGLGAGSIKLNYFYTGDFKATPEIQTMSASWYNDGIEVIFGCGGAVGNSVMAAAQDAGTKVIGVDIDQSGESPTVITSAMKGLAASVYACIKDYYDGKFPGGENRVFDAANDGVGLPMGASKFSSFTQADYDAIFQKLVKNEVVVFNYAGVTGAPSPMGISTTAVTVTDFN